MTDPSSTVEHPPLPHRPGRSARLLRTAVATAILGTCAWGAWLGGPLGLAAVAGAALTLFGIGRTGPVGSGDGAASAETSAATAESSASAAAPPQAGGSRTARVDPMVSKVVPVWVRQIETTRSTADAGLNNVLQSFTAMNGSLDTLLSNLQGMAGTARPGAVDEAVAGSAGPLAALMSPSARAFAQRDQAVRELHHCSAQMAELAQLSRQAREIGRHTRLVAFNASIEASRDQRSQDGGNETVAQEMRLIATRMSENAASMHKLVTDLQQRVDGVRHASVTQESTTEELRLEIELRAREALQSLLGSVGASLSTSGSVREASAALQQHLEDAFVHFQFGDRLSQMLAIVGNDMNNFVDWTSRHPDATFDDANEWLKRLEASYTMEEQRSEHHGNVHVDRGSEVEFF